MPGDALFEGQSGATTDTTATPGTPTPAPSVTPEQLSAVVAPIAASVQRMESSFADIQRQAAQGAAPRETTPPKDWQERFFEDTRGAIDERVNLVTAPVVAQSAATIGEFVLNAERTRIESEYGPGSWDKVWSDLKPVYERVLREDPVQIHNRTGILNAVNTIIGRKASEFFDLRAKHQTDSKAADEKFENDLIERVSGRVVPMTGGFRKTGGEAQLNDGHRAALEEIQRATGEDTGDEKYLASLMGLRRPMGAAGHYTTFADWKKAQPKAAGAR